MMMTLNIAKANPIYFANNVLEPIRNRIHSDGFYHSFSIGMIKTNEGV